MEPCPCVQRPLSLRLLCDLRREATRLMSSRYRLGIWSAALYLRSVDQAMACLCKAEPRYFVPQRSAARPVEIGQDTSEVREDHFPSELAFTLGSPSGSRLLWTQPLGTGNDAKTFLDIVSRGPLHDICQYGVLSTFQLQAAIETILGRELPPPFLRRAGSAAAREPLDGARLCVYNQ
jgi:hypothetical protein